MPFPFRPSREKINQGPNPIGKDDDKYPDDFIVSLRTFILETIDQHPNPENKGTQSKYHKSTKHDYVEEHHPFGYVLDFHFSLLLTKLRTVIKDSTYGQLKTFAAG